MLSKYWRIQEWNEKLVCKEPGEKECWYKEKLHGHYKRQAQEDYNWKQWFRIKSYKISSNSS